MPVLKGKHHHMANFLHKYFINVKYFLESSFPAKCPSKSHQRMETIGKVCSNKISPCKSIKNLSFVLGSSLLTSSGTPPDILTTPESIMNAKLSLNRLWHCHESGFNTSIQTLPHNSYWSVKPSSLF